MFLSLCLQGEYVWVRPPLEQINDVEFAVPVAARILRTEKARVLVCDDDNQQYWVTNGDIVKVVHLTSLTDVDDMITLGDLQEYTILRNLETRYRKKLIYVSKTSQSYARKIHISQ